MRSGHGDRGLVGKATGPRRRHGAKGKFGGYPRRVSGFIASPDLLRPDTGSDKITPRAKALV
jgi:hypothetical protein